MPEGHLIHHLARLQGDGLLGETAVSSPQGRFAAAGLLDGTRLHRIEPYGKHLFYWWAGGVVHVHLGMRGVIVPHDLPPPDPRPQVRLRITGPARSVDLIAPLRCELVGSAGRDDIVSRLGPDPLRDGDAGDRVWDSLQGRRRSIGAALLDQGVVSGIGNVIRAEALHAAGIHPRRPASTLTSQEFRQLWQAVLDIMRDAADIGRIVTADRPDGGERNVYKQATCGTCGHPVDAFDLAGRTAYACGVDQPLDAGDAG